MVQIINPILYGNSDGGGGRILMEQPIYKEQVQETL